MTGRAIPHFRTALSLILCLGSYFTLALLQPGRSSPVLFLVLVATASLAMWLVRLELRAGRLGVRHLIGLALIVRLLLIPTPPDLSEDAYRYLWDGLRTIQFENPFVSPPSELVDRQQAHSELFAQMDHTTRTSIYPPFAQLLFSCSTLIGGSSTTVWKLLLLAFELILWALFLRGFRTGPHQAALWMLHPLVVVEFYSSGHLDVVALSLMLLGLWLTSSARWNRAAGRGWVSGVALGLAGSTKIFPFFALPLFLRRGQVGATLAATIGISGLIASPFFMWHDKGLLALQSFWSILRVYGSTWEFNSFIFQLLPSWRIELGWITAAVFAIWVAYLATKGPRDSVQSAYLLFLGLLGLSHTVHPWYATWALVFCPLLPRRSRAGMYLSLVVPASYFFYSQPSSGVVQFILLLQWIPFYVLFLDDYRRYHSVQNARTPLSKSRSQGPTG